MTAIDYGKVKVQVGQVWVLDGQSKEYTITRVSGSGCYHMEGSDEKCFGTLKPDGTPSWLTKPAKYGWQLKENTLWTMVQDVSINSAVSNVAINDFICPTCKNDRCSKTEKSCWKCGNPLHV